MLSLLVFIYLGILLGITTISIFYIIGILITCVFILVKELVGYNDNFNLEEISLNFVKQKIHCEYQFKVINMDVMNYKIIMKSIIIDRKKDKDIIFVHGVNSGTTVWLNIVQELLNKYDNYNLHLLYTPGSGCSEILDINNFLQEDCDYISKFFSSIINKYIEQYNIKNSILVGHSLGGYMVLNYLCDINKKKRSSNIIKVIAINPVGITSSFGYQGFYTISFIKFGVINLLFNYFNSYSYNLCFFLIYIYKYIFGDEFWYYENTHYHFATLSSRSNYSYLILDKFLKIEECNAMYLRPIIHKLMNKQDVPIHIISSEFDLVVTKSYNEILKFLEHSGSLLTVLKGKTHSPFEKKDSQIIAEIINNNSYHGFFKKISIKKSYELKKIIDKYVSHYDYNYSYYNSDELLNELKNFLS